MTRCHSCRSIALPTGTKTKLSQHVSHQLGHNAQVVLNNASTRRRTTRLAAAITIAGLICVSIAVDGLTAAAESKPTVTAASTLEATAIASAKAWLTGTADDIRKYQGPRCVSTTHSDASPAQEAAALKKARALWAQSMGRPLKTIKILGAQVRNLTATSGEAEVAYDLPTAVAGNDNWVGFKRYNGRWKVADCHMPFGGNAEKAVPATPTT